VKLEKASKVKSRMPTRPLTGEGSTDREDIETYTCSIRRGSERGIQNGELGNCGRSGRGEGRTFNILYRAMASSEVGEGRTTVDAE